MTDSAAHYLKRELYELVRRDGTIFEFLQAGSLDGLWFWDVENPTEEWLSPRFKEVFGYADEEIPNTSAWWQANIFPEDLPVALDNFQRHCADPRHPYDQVVRYRHKNGSTVWIRCRGIAIRNAAGQAVRMLGAHTDVTALVGAQELKHRQLARAEAEQILEGISDAFVALDRNWCFTYVNARAGQIFGQTAGDYVGKHIWTEFPESVDQFRPAFERAMREQVTVELEEYYAPFDRWLEVRVNPTAGGLSIFFRDITVRKSSAALVEGQKQILERVAKGGPLAEILAALMIFLESQSRGILCSVLLVDDDGKRVRHGAAPSLPPEFNRAIDGAEFGPVAGSCGTAIHRREPVLVADIATDPLWAEYKQLALPHGLLACWSTPIFDADENVLGSFAIYSRKTGLPTERHRELIGFATHTAAICISRQRARTTLERERSQSSAVLNSLSAHIAVVDDRGVVLAVNEAWRRFARANDAGDSSSVQPGSNYLAILERAADAGEMQAQTALDGIRQVLRREREHFELEYPCDSPKETRRFLLIVTALSGSRGAVLAHEDITARTLAVEAMRDSAMFNRQIIAGANEGIVVLDRQLRYLVWNPFMEELLGLTAAEVLGRHPAELFPWIREGGQLAAMERALAGEIIVLPDNQRIRTGTKRISWLHARLAPLRDARNVIIGIIVTIADITERKQAEDQLHRSHEQLRALAGRLQSVREEQSAHIAREIHDVLGQQLTALKLDLTWLKRRINSVEDEALRTTLSEKVTASTTLVDDTIKTVQKVATELRPGLLDKLGLTAALEHEAKLFSTRAGLKSSLKLAVSPPHLDKGRALEVFRICQELLTNIARHAQATAFELQLTCPADRLVLEVTDDGRGITDQQLAGNRSLGLLGMRERAQLLGGTLDIQGATGKGTVAVLSIPVKVAS